MLTLDTNKTVSVLREYFIVRDAVNIIKVLDKKRSKECDWIPVTI